MHSKASLETRIECRSNTALGMPRTRPPHASRWFGMSDHPLANNGRFVAQSTHSRLSAFVRDRPADSHNATEESFIEEVVQRGPHLTNAHLLAYQPASGHSIPDGRSLSAMDSSHEGQNLSAKPGYVATRLKPISDRYPPPCRHAANRSFRVRQHAAFPPDVDGVFGYAEPFGDLLRSHDVHAMYLSPVHHGCQVLRYTRGTIGGRLDGAVKGLVAATTNADHSGLSGHQPDAVGRLARAPAAIGAAPLAKVAKSAYYLSR